MTSIMPLRLKRNYIVGALRNSSEALGMALRLMSQDNVWQYNQGVQELVLLLDSTAIKLRNVCEKAEYNINHPT